MNLNLNYNISLKHIWKHMLAYLEYSYCGIQKRVKPNSFRLTYLETCIDKEAPPFIKDQTLLADLKVH